MIINSGTIVALVFVVISIAILLAVSFNGKGFLQSAVRKYIIAATGVYVSGTVLVALLYLFRNDLPSVFVYVAEAMMLCVFAVTMWAIKGFTEKFDELKKEAEDKKLEESSEENN